MAFNITGLSSQLDWGTMITQLVALERKPITALETNKTALSAKKTAWSEVNTKLLSLKTAVTDLSARNDFNVFSASATMSNPSKAVGDLLSYAVGTTASVGTYDIVINRRATADKIATDSFSSSSDDLTVAGTLTINGQDITIESTDSLSNVQNKINDLNSGTDATGVTASIIKVYDDATSTDGYRLTLTADETGEDGLTVSGTALAGLGLDDEANVVTSGQDAWITVDGFDAYRSSNTISDVISGVTLNLVGADTGATVTLNINRDYDGIKEKIKTFVDAYNGLMTYIADQGTASDDGKTTKPLFADSSVRSVKTTLRSVILSEVSGLDSTLNRLSAIGISIDKTGQLSIDEDTLDGYLETNFADVVNLFAAQGTSSSNDLSFVYSGNATESGDYEVEITEVATKASVTGSGFSWTPGSDATLTLTSSSGTAQSITLNAESDIDAIVEAINAGNTLGITAENDDGELKLSNSSYGSAGSFTVSGTAAVSLGLDNASATGQDVAGQISNDGGLSWMTMTGRGQTLTGDDDQDVDGLVIEYTGTTTTTDPLDFSFIKGVADKLDNALYSMTDTYGGYVGTKQKTLQSQMDKIDKKIANMEVRLTRYQETLTAKYSAMEAMLSTLQSQQSWLTSQINSLPSSKS